MKSLVFFAILALRAVCALPTAEPVPLPEPLPEALPHKADGACDLNNGSTYTYEYDLAGTTLYNPCGNSGVFTSGKSKYSSYYLSYSNGVSYFFCSRYKNKYTGVKAVINGTTYKVISRSNGESEGTWSDSASSGEYWSTSKFKLDGPGRLRDSELTTRYKTKYECVTGRDPQCIFEYFNQETRINC